MDFLPDFEIKIFPVSTEEKRLLSSFDKDNPILLNDLDESDRLNEFTFSDFFKPIEINSFQMNKQKVLYFKLNLVIEEINTTLFLISKIDIQKSENTIRNRMVLVNKKSVKDISNTNFLKVLFLK